MDKTMTPPKRMTDRQIEKGADVFRVALRKHRSEFESETSQKALGSDGLASDLLAVFRKHVELFGNMITRIITVNRGQTPQEMLNATSRRQYVNSDVANSMPRGEGEKTKVVFFKPDPSAYNENGWISDDNLEKEFEKRGLKPVDPYSLAKVNEDDPSFADSHPNSTHWKDSNGNWCYTAFDRWHDDERCVNVYRYDYDWNDYWWFGGVRK